jgi:glycerol-3-phosphate dehydrogenase subunit B
MQDDVIVIGAGYAGLMAATVAARRGARVRLIAKGNGGTHLKTGCVDVLGYRDGTRVEAPLQAVAHPELGHPYGRIGVEAARAALAIFSELMAAEGYPFVGDGERNWLLPTAIGAVRPTALAPATMAAGDLTRPEAMAVVGFHNFKDFYPRLLADNLQRSLPALEVKALTLVAPGFEDEADLPPMTFARAFDHPGFREQLARMLKPDLRGIERVGFPALLGVKDAPAAVADLERLLEARVFEIPTLPPSIPGIRTFMIFDRVLRRLGARVQLGHPVIGYKADEHTVTAVTTSSAARPKDWRAGEFVLATGGVAGGGIVVDSRRRATETVFDLPVAHAEQALNFNSGYFEPHPASQIGLAVDDLLRPLDVAGAPAFINLRAAGQLLAGAEPWREKSGEGISLGSGYKSV